MSSFQSKRGHRSRKAHHRHNASPNELSSSSTNTRDRHQESEYSDRRLHSRHRKSSRSKNRRYQGSTSWNTTADDNQGDGGNQGDEGVVNIPGFYYDVEKKKYFKILPNHNHCASGSITKEVIKKIRVEKKRQKDLVDLFKPRTVDYKLLGNRPLCLRSFNIYHLLTGGRVGLRSSIATAATFRKYMAQGLVPRAKCPVVQLVPGEFAFDLDNLDDVRQMILSEDSTSLVGVWSLKEFIRQRLQEIHIKPTRRVDSEGNVRLATKANELVHAFDIQKVTSLCWAPRPEDIGKTSRILFTTSSVLGDGDNMARVCDISSEGHSYNDFFSLGPKATWSCAWSRQSNQFSVGTDSCSVLIDIATRRLWELYSGNSAVYTMTISKQTGQTMYSGTKRGNIYTHDLRSHVTLPVSTLSHRYSISHVHLSTDEQSLIASDVSGKIKKWDRRQRKVIHEYPGHVNQYVRQPFHVDHSENMLFSVGEDCYTRIWCFRTGLLLHTLPSPYPVSIDSIPIVAYSDTMGGHGGLPGLLMACRNTLHFYTI